MPARGPRIAMVHEWFACYAGSEKVVEQMLHVYPEAQLHALIDFLPASERRMLQGRNVKTSFLQRMPFAGRKYRSYLPLMPLAIEQFDLSDYEIVLSSNHAVAKGVITRPDQLHICYTHTPIRYAWDLQHQYLRESGLTRGLKSILARIVLHYLRIWDALSAQRVDVFVANSGFIAERIRKTYGREAEVIHPPVDVAAFPVCESKQDYYLTASRLVPYKKVDLIVEAFRRMPDRKLIVIGDGPLFRQVAARVPSNVELLGYQPHDALVRHMQQAKAFLFAAEEDFGIAPVEAQACGTPVIAYGRGGSRETVVEGVTGNFFAEQTPESLVDAVEDFESRAADFDPRQIRAHAERFSPERFRAEFRDLVQRSWTRFQFQQRPHAFDSSPRSDDARAMVMPSISPVPE